MGWGSGKSQVSEDLDQMQVVTAIRGVSDYQIFVDAYRQWHGEEPREADLEADFARYLRSGSVPQSVRHYLRQFNEQHPEALATYRRELRKGARIRRIGFWVIVLLVILALWIF